MNAFEHGFGYIVPMPRFWDSQLGSIVYIDDGGVVKWVGDIFEDGHFKTLVHGDIATLKTSTEERHPSLTAAFTVGSMEVKSIPKEQYSK